MPGLWVKTAELRDDLLVNTVTDTIHAVVERAEAGSLHVLPNEELTVIVVIATPLPPSALDVLKKRVEERLNLERPYPDAPTWTQSHRGVELIFVPNAIPIDSAHNRTALVIGAWYPITEPPKVVQDTLTHAQHLHTFRRDGARYAPQLSPGNRHLLPPGETEQLPVSQPDPAEHRDLNDQGNTGTSRKNRPRRKPHGQA
jgi:hypothetical protein